MTKHVLDRPRSAFGGRLARFARIERLRGVKARPQVEALRRAKRPQAKAARLRQFLTIDRTTS